MPPPLLSFPWGLSESFGIASSTATTDLGTSPSSVVSSVWPSFSTVTVPASSITIMMTSEVEVTQTLVSDHTTVISVDGKTFVSTQTAAVTVTATRMQEHTATAVVDHTWTATAHDNSPSTLRTTLINTAVVYSTVKASPTSIVQKPTTSPVATRSSSPSPPPAHSDHHSNTALIVGLSVGFGVFLIAAIALSALYFLFRRRQSQHIRDNQLENSTWQSAAYSLVNLSKLKPEKKADKVEESSPTKRAPGPRTFNDLHSANLPRRRSRSAHSTYSNTLSTPLEVHEHEEENPFLSPEERAARSPQKNAKIPRAMSILDCESDDEATQMDLRRDASVERRSRRGSAVMDGMVRREEENIKKHAELVKELEDKREERNKRQKPE
ncbi:uncharacterized protein BKA78DRAFT_347008 [Phyllosticta capitalensis]|uniref:Uncharacterized protein n=1 Tax=Phyllosticta capitalensis TaxID=121624 RepID=A0ABR1YG94_9PEZI